MKHIQDDVAARNDNTREDEFLVESGEGGSMIRGTENMEASSMTIEEAGGLVTHYEVFSASDDLEISSCVVCRSGIQ